MSAQTAHSYLSTAPNLQALLQHAQKLVVLQEIWNGIAPRPLANASTVGAVRGQTLIIYARNGAVAAKLRQLVPRLLEEIQKRGVGVIAIQVAVQIEPLRPANKPKDLAVSQNALASLAQLEQSLAASPLKSALRALIKRHSNPVQDQAPHHQQRGENQQERQGKLEQLPGEPKVANIPGKQEHRRGNRDRDQPEIDKKP